jgi:hypothetical protein
MISIAIPTHYFARRVIRLANGRQQDATRAATSPYSGHSPFPRGLPESYL